MITIHKNRENYALSMIQKYKNLVPSNVLSDIGAGWGWLEPHCISNNLVWQPFDNVRKISGSIMWDLNQSYPCEAKQAGMAVFLEVLEHLPNPLMAIQNISEHLLPGAIVIMSVPNPSWSRNRLHLLAKGTLYAFQKKHLIEHHVFTPWRHIVEFYFEQSGFEVIEYHAIQQVDTKSQGIKEFILRQIQYIIEKRDPKSIGLSYGLVLRKKSDV